ncbi:MAG: ABC transporter substrate-binding protein, partial [Planctomycetota bacterium]
AAQGGSTLDTELLDLPDRRIPNPLPQSGKLELRLVDQPSTPYYVAWASIDKIELYEQLLLQEASRLAGTGEFVQAFEYLAFLQSNYPRLPRLEASVQSYLWNDAKNSLVGGEAEAALIALAALHDRNPRFAGLSRAVVVVSDAMIQRQIDAGAYRAARENLDMLKSLFPTLELANVARWQSQFRSDAREQLALAREALSTEEYSAARDAIQRARAIDPSIEGAAALLVAIQRAAPAIRVGVYSAPGVDDDAPLLDWSTRRLASIAEPQFFEMVDFGAEGGQYRCRWAELEASNAGLSTRLQFAPAAHHRGILPERLSLELLDRANAGAPGSRGQLNALLGGIEIERGNALRVDWLQPPIRPEALLSVPLRALTSAVEAPGLWFDVVESSDAADTVVQYKRTGVANKGGESASFVEERIYQDDEHALAGLLRGDVDVLERVAPWQMERLSRADDVVVGRYRLPTVHMLTLDYGNPLLEIREYRRALCYGINREAILTDVLLGGDRLPGWRTLSGPFPAGESLNDPLNYAYDADLAPRRWEPQLAALLSRVARETLAKRTAA